MGYKGFIIGDNEAEIEDRLSGYNWDDKRMREEEVEKLVENLEEAVRRYSEGELDDFLDPAGDDNPHLDSPGVLTEEDLDIEEGEDLPEWRTNHIAYVIAMVGEKIGPLNDQYDRSDALPLSSVICAEIYRQATGIKNYPQLISHLRRKKHRDNIPVHKMLGFESIPHDNTLRTAAEERLDRDGIEFIKHWTHQAERVAINKGYDFPDISDKRLSNNGGIVKIPVELKRGYAQGALDLLRDDMPIKKEDPDVAMWTDYGKHFDFSLHLCDTGGSPESELENFADNRGLQKGVDIFETAETFRNDITRVSTEEWENTFNDWTHRILNAVYPESLREDGLAISVDTTDIPTWSSDPDEIQGVVGTKKHPNTHHAYQIMSAIDVTNGLPFQIAHELQEKKLSKRDQIEGLINAVRDQGCNIGMLLADSDFATGQVANLLKGENIDFVIAYPTNWITQYTEEWEEAEQTVGIEQNYIIRKDATFPTKAEVNLFGEYHSKLGSETDNAQTNLCDFFHPDPEYISGRQTRDTVASYIDQEDAGNIFEMDNKMQWHTFMTNRNIKKSTARGLRDFYHYRWAIESAYGTYKENFLPKTKSTNLKIRLYLYLFGMAAYNAWVSANAKARNQHLEDNERNRPPIRASRFNTLGQQRYQPEFETDYINFQ